MILRKIKNIYSNRDYYYSIFFRLSNAALTFLITKILVDKIGLSSYGKLFAVFSYVNFILIVEFSYNGLRNHLSQAYFNNNFKKTKEIINNSYSLSFYNLFLLCIPIFILLTRTIYNENSSQKTFEIILISLALASVPLFKLILSVLYSINKNSTATLIEFLNTFLIFCFYSFIPSKYFTLSALVQIQYLILVVILIISSVLYYYKNTKIPFTFKLVKLPDTSYIFKEGFNFFIAQAITNIIPVFLFWSISKFQNNNQAGQYAIVSKFYAAALTFYSILTTPLWGYIQTQVSLNSKSGLFRYIKKLNRLTILFSILVFMIFFLSNIIIRWWLNITVNLSINLFSFLFSILQLLTLHFSILSSGMGYSKAVKNASLFGLIAGIVFSPLFYQFSEHFYYYIIYTVEITIIGFLFINYKKQKSPIFE